MHTHTHLAGIYLKKLQLWMILEGFHGHTFVFQVEIAFFE